MASNRSQSAKCQTKRRFQDRTGKGKIESECVASWIITATPDDCFKMPGLLAWAEQFFGRERDLRFRSWILDHEKGAPRPRSLRWSKNGSRGAETRSPREEHGCIFDFKALVTVRPDKGSSDVQQAKIIAS
jgi:hypothetical protein